MASWNFGDNPNRLAEAKEDAEKQHPVVLYKDPGSSLYIYVDGAVDEYERLTWQKFEVIVQSREVEGSSLGRLASL